MPVEMDPAVCVLQEDPGRGCVTVVAGGRNCGCSPISGTGPFATDGLGSLSVLIQCVAFYSG